MKRTTTQTKTKLTVKRKVVALQPKQLQNVTGGKGGTVSGGGVDPCGAYSRLCTGW